MCAGVCFMPESVNSAADRRCPQPLQSRRLLQVESGRLEEAWGSLSLCITEEALGRRSRHRTRQWEYSPGLFWIHLGESTKQCIPRFALLHGRANQAPGPMWRHRSNSGCRGRMRRPEHGEVPSSGLERLASNSPTSWGQCIQPSVLLAIVDLPRSACEKSAPPSTFARAAPTAPRPFWHTARLHLAHRPCPPDPDSRSSRLRLS